HPRYSECFPSQIDGVDVDILERSYRSAAASDVVNPLMGGAGIAETGRAADFGTLGGIVYSGNRERYITNQHVAGNSGSVIVQPPSGNAGTLPGNIGTVLSSLRNTILDCAIIQPDPARKNQFGILGLPPGQPPQNAIFAYNKLTFIDEHSTKAFKIGAATGFNPIRVGTVKNVNTFVEIDNIFMSRQIVVDSDDETEIIEGGDSGSLLLVESATPNGYFVVGLVHAETNKRQSIVATHFDEIINEFGVSVLPF
uniref:hypothetical protein n=1 Tax=uncultured Rubinisphaera sp. TaxID=1678686 RepID=UPI0030DB6802